MAEEHVGEFRMINFMEGVHTWPNGVQYEGQYRDGTRHGFSKLMLENGEVFTGEHKFGKRDGHGIHIIPNKRSRMWGHIKMARKTGRNLDRVRW